MAELKTQKHVGSVSAFLNAVPNDTRRQDAKVVLKLLEKVTGKKAKMWGPSIIGFDEYHYKYASGHEGDMCMIGFSPRAQALTLYMMPGFTHQEKLLEKLGKHKTGKGCLYVNKLADVDLAVLEQMMRDAYTWMQQKYPKSD